MSADPRLVTVRLADLANGAAVVLARARVGPLAGARREVVVDGADARIRCDAAEVETIRVVEPDLTVAGTTTNQETGEVTAWCWRVARLRVRVAFADGVVPAEPVTATLDNVFIGSDGTRIDRQEGDPFNFAWLRSRRVESASAPVPVVVGTEVATTMPRVRGFAIRARAGGWLTAVERVPDALPDGEWAVTLTLRRTRVITGRVVDSAGRPIPDADVRTHVSWSDTFEGTSPDALRAIGGGVAARWSSREGRSHVTSVRGCRARADGTFTAGAHRDGEVLIAVFVRGFRTGWFKGTQGDFDLRAGDIVLLPDDGPRVRIVRRGVAVPAGTSVRIADISVGEAQPTCPELSADDDGCIPAGWLESGHAYTILVTLPDAPRHPHSGELVWDGRTELDAALLESHVELVRRK